MSSSGSRIVTRTDTLKKNTSRSAWVRSSQSPSPADRSLDPTSSGMSARRAALWMGSKKVQKSSCTVARIGVPRRKKSAEGGGGRPRRARASPASRKVVPPRWPVAVANHRPE
ncbi:hypothetical protein NL676_021879 [Syzygium grande]|nr:hypothetical protein NL676_021879 [Syzygium grande]